MQEPEIIFNPKAKITGQFIGNEQQPLLIIDDVLLNPEEIYNYAIAQEYSSPNTSSYPGINAKLPVNYSKALVTALVPILNAGFNFEKGIALDLFGFIGLSTKSADELKPTQRIPHFDSTDPLRIAIVHYFCSDDFGGTGFFRHKATGIETATTSNIKMLEFHISNELKTNIPITYANKDTPFFEIIHECPAKFNRLVAYRGNCFHSAMLEGNQLTSNPSKGRITINTFVEPLKT